MIKALILSFSLLLSAPSCLKLDIMLVGDYSGSVMGSESFISDAFTAFSSRFKISEEDVKIGMIIFADTPTVLCPLTSDAQLLSSRLLLLKNTTADPNGMTHITSALQEAANQLHSNGRENVRKLIIIVSDGLHNGEDGSYGLITTSNFIQKTGIIVCTVVIDNNSTNKELMENVASSGFYVESSYGTLVDELKHLDVCL